MIESEKRIPLDANSFQAGGKTFIIYGSVNIERYTIMQELEVRSMFGADFAQLHRAFVEWVNLKNQKKDFDADIKLRNTFEGVLRKANNQYDPLLLICTLFMCEADEDRKTWDEANANEKIKLWSEEGYPTEDFLRWGLRFSRLYQLGSDSDTPLTLESQPET